MGREVRKSVVTPAEYREAVKAAEVLGMELKSTDFFGTWTENKDGIPCWPGKDDLVNDGQTLFKVEMDGEEYKIYSDDADARLELTFR